MSKENQGAMRSAITISLVPEARGGPFVFWDDLGAGIERAARLGFDAVEIFPPNPEFIDHSKAADLVAQAGLAVAAVGTGAGWVVHRWSLVADSPSERQHAIDFVKHMIDAAATLRAPAIIGSMQGRSLPELGRDGTRGRLRDSLEILDTHASQHGGQLLYEPLNRYETDLCNTLDIGLRLIDGLISTRLLADWFHMNIEEADLSAAIRRAGTAIGHVHFADSNRSAVGMGHQNPEPLIQALRDVGYSGYLSAEVFPLPDSETAAQTTIASFRRWLP